VQQLLRHQESTQQRTRARITANRLPGSIPSSIWGRLTTGLQFSDNSKLPQDAAIRYEPAAAANNTTNKNETNIQQRN
jgi:hypothetical protein